MRESIFEYTNYVDFLKNWVIQKGHGSKSQLAQTAQVQTTYLSLVLKNQAHLNLEQALRLKTLLGLNHAELDFFLLLLQKNKAGSTDLEEYFGEKIQNQIQQRTQLRERIANPITFTLEQQSVYFSSWHYAAIHTAILIPSLRTREHLELFFRLPSEVISEALEFLEKLHLISKENGRYTLNSFRMHLPNDSSLINLHHSNWRLQALQNMQKRNLHDLHLSSVLSLSKKDAESLKKKLLDLIENFEQTLKNSEDEVLYSLGLDWFEIK